MVGLSVKMHAKDVFYVVEMPNVRLEIMKACVRANKDLSTMAKVDVIELNVNVTENAVRTDSVRKIYVNWHV